MGFIYCCLLIGQDEAANLVRLISEWETETFLIIKGHNMDCDIYENLLQRQ